MHTKYFIDLIMGNVFGSKVEPGIPETYYVGLSSTTPDVEGNGVTEPSAENTGYTRIPIDAFSVPADGIVKNSSAVQFEESLLDWGTATHYVVFDSPTVGSGNLLFFGALTAERTIDANSMVILRANEIELSLTNKTSA